MISSLIIEISQVFLEFDCCVFLLLILAWFLAFLCVWAVLFIDFEKLFWRLLWDLSPVMIWVCFFSGNLGALPDWVIFKLTCSLKFSWWPKSCEFGLQTYMSSSLWQYLPRDSATPLPCVKATPESQVCGVVKQDKFTAGLPLSEVLTLWVNPELYGNSKA